MPYVYKHGVRYDRSRRPRRRSNRRAQPHQPPSTPSDPQSAAVARFLKSPQFTDALLGAMARGGWRSRRAPREEGQGHPGGWMSRGKRRGY